MKVTNLHVMMNNASVLQKNTLSTKSPSSRIQKNHPEEFIIGDINSGVETRSKRQQPILEKKVSLLSLTEPKKQE